MKVLINSDSSGRSEDLILSFKDFVPLFSIEPDYVGHDPNLPYRRLWVAVLAYAIIDLSDKSIKVREDARKWINEREGLFDLICWMMDLNSEMIREASKKIGLKDRDRLMVAAMTIRSRREGPRKSRP